MPHDTLTADQTALSWKYGKVDGPGRRLTALTDVPMKTYYGGSLNPPQVWPKTLDFPAWNTLIDGHPFVLETYEDRAMMYNQVDAQQTIRPKAEACLTCHGTKVAYYTGINGVAGYPARTRTIQNTQVVSQGSAAGHDPTSVTLTVPAGTRISSYVDTVNAPLHQVKTLVTLPNGKVYASYAYPRATATGVDPDPSKAAEARNWIWAAEEALAFDGLDPVKNRPSMDAGVTCNMCHYAMGTKLRIIQKPLIWSIAQRGISPYSDMGSQIKSFDRASRKDQIVAVCAQCHVEYTGGYSAVDRVDRYIIPWAKVADVESLYARLFGYNQDWVHGVGVRPWQITDPGQRGYYPAGSLAGINRSLIKSQHPESELLWDSPMYNAGATCTDCHAPRLKSSAGKPYTSHWFASPLKYMTATPTKLSAARVNPCATCHPTQSVEAKKLEVKTAQDGVFALQQQVQQALVEAPEAINAAEAKGRNVDQAVSYYRMAHLRWEYHVQAENSMGFHNTQEAMRELQTALGYAQRARQLAP